MSTDRNKTFGKKEHLCKLTLIEQLFGGGAKAMTAWPMRMVFLLVDKKDEQAPSVQVLISVSKRYFKHAVKRNRVKRQIREAFRHQNKSWRLVCRIMLENNCLWLLFGKQNNCSLQSWFQPK